MKSMQNFFSFLSTPFVEYVTHFNTMLIQITKTTVNETCLQLFQYKDSLRHDRNAHCSINNTNLAILLSMVDSVTWDRYIVGYVTLTYLNCFIMHHHWQFRNYKMCVSNIPHCTIYNTTFSISVVHFIFWDHLHCVIFHIEPFLHHICNTNHNLHYYDRAISQIPQCTSPISDNLKNDGNVTYYILIFNLLPP